MEKQYKRKKIPLKIHEKKHNEQYIGKKVEVLFEEKEGKYIKGHTTNYMVVKVPYEPIENSIEKVYVSKFEEFELIGNIEK